MPASVKSSSRLALFAGLFAISFGALATSSERLAYLLLLATGASTPPFIDLVRRAASSGRPAAPTPQPDVAPRATSLLTTLLVEPAQDLSNAELCKAWRRSFLALQSANTNGERETVVALRQGYLDEMESRNASALRAWLASGARAVGGPERFLLDADSDQSEAA